MGKKRINYVGWLGFGNLGDSALYIAIKSILNPYSYDLNLPNEPSENRKSLSPVTIIGGSTGIPDWIQDFKFAKLNYIFGAGVKDPNFPGYKYLFKDSLKTKVAIERLKIFKNIGVRGVASLNLLMKWGIKSEVIGDPCFSLRSIIQKKDEKKIAINIGSDGILWGMNEESVFRQVAKSL